MSPAEREGEKVEKEGRREGGRNGEQRKEGREGRGRKGEQRKEGREGRGESFTVYSSK